MKIDLMKAYDSIQRDFIINILKAIGTAPQFTNYIALCVMSPKYLIAINGGLAQTRGPLIPLSFSNDYGTAV